MYTLRNLNIFVFTNNCVSSSNFVMFYHKSAEIIYYRSVFTFYYSNVIKFTSYVNPFVS